MKIVIETSTVKQSVLLISSIYILPKFLNIMKSDNTRRKSTMLLNFQDMFRLGTPTIIS